MPADPAKQRQFARTVRRLIRDSQRMEDDAVKRALRLLNDARLNIINTVATTEWQAFYLPMMKRSIETTMADLQAKYVNLMEEHQRAAWQAGIDRVDVPIRQSGILATMQGMDETALAIMQGFSPDLITGLTQDAIKAINTQLTLGMMGQKPPYEVMKAVGRNLKDKSVFKSIAQRAETIVRTETGRVMEAASFARQTEGAKVIPGLKKQWLHTHIVANPRPDHLAIHEQIRPVDEPYDLPDGTQLMFPKDPAGPAHQTIACGCASVPYMEEWD